MYNISQRYVVYCMMLEEFERAEASEEETTTRYLCQAHDRINSIDRLDWDEILYIKRPLPELWEKRPKKLYLSSKMWFRPNETNKRIRLLKQCIRETHPENPKNKRAYAKILSTQ